MPPTTLAGPGFPLRWLAPLPGLLVLAAISHRLAAVLTGRDQERARHELLMRAGTELMAGSDRTEISRVACEVAQALLMAAADTRGWVALGTTEPVSAHNRWVKPGAQEQHAC